MRATPSLLTELMPLTEATAACHHILTHGARRLAEADLEQARSDIAMALVNLIPVFAEDAGHKRPLAAGEVNERFAGSRSPMAQMNGLYVRRSDVVRAVEILQGSPPPRSGGGSDGSART